MYRIDARYIGVIGKKSAKTNSALIGTHWPATKESERSNNCANSKPGFGWLVS